MGVTGQQILIVQFVLQAMKELYLQIHALLVVQLVNGNLGQTVSTATQLAILVMDPVMRVA
jgi:hypothetical protein